ncbi:sugar ABC transporter substrate-binding protein [Saccharothrix syringae]|uniref:Sugar ABC transporter substrate-binding protein n=1 Tax=Saccharothrix syringae TaxID=103733 RepID=A0A5Q0HDD1_SACSY|nr:sugar ABC transporter substrate-binding protein [Saccharothrix syringae]
MVVLGGGVLVTGALVLLRAGVLTRAVPAWTAVVAVALGAAPALLLRRSRRGRRTRQVFLITSAFRQKYWVADFLQRLHGVLDRSGVDLVLKVPARDYDAAAQAHHLRRVLASADRYAGGFVVATEVHRMQADLVEFCAELGLPVVFTDIEPFDDVDRYPDNAAFVGYLSHEIGALAGRWLVSRLQRWGVARPHVLVVASREHADRQARCAEVVRETWPDARLVIQDDCAFSRSRAYDAVLAEVRRVAARGDRLDAVFCTNDEMALGAVDALRVANSPATGEAVVIGVDGVLEARALIDAGTSPLRATVVQDSHRLAESAAHVLERMCKGRAVARRTVLEPEVHEAGA